MRARVVFMLVGLLGVVLTAQAPEVPPLPADQAQIQALTQAYAQQLVEMAALHDQIGKLASQAAMGERLQAASLRGEIGETAVITARVTNDIKAAILKANPGATIDKTWKVTLPEAATKKY